MGGFGARTSATCRRWQWQGAPSPEAGGGYGVADLVVGRCLIEMKTTFDRAADMPMSSSTGATPLGVDTSAAYLGWLALRPEPSLVVLASAPSRNNPVRGGVQLTGGGEMPADWVSRQSRQNRFRSRWRRYPGSWVMAR